MIFQSIAMQAVLRQAHRFARSTAAVLITGESGTGKEVLARFIHENSLRCDRPYIRLNCAALPDGLVESELFGHERGAFTGAVCRRAGRFEEARSGTLLLDEVSEIPVRMQAKMLRVLEEDEFVRVGGNRTMQADVRIIASSNRELAQEVADGGFRDDLYHRLNILRLHVPPLRDRREDIPLLVQHFIHRFRDEAAVPLRGAARDVMRRLCDDPWPGNIRQLRNVIHRACVLCESEYLQLNDLPEREELVPADSAATPEAFETMPLAEIERHVILTRIRRFHGNKSAAAAELGVTPRTLRNKMQHYRQLGYVP